MRVEISGFAVLLLATLLSVQAHAQVAGGTLSGTISDPSGAVIPNAQTSLRNVATGITRNIVTDPAGFYTVPNLLPGNYEITVSAPGFATHVGTGINLHVGAQQVLNITMQLGQASQKFEVTGEAPEVQGGVSESFLL